MEAALRLIDTVPGAVRWSQGKRTVDLKRVYEDEDWIDGLDESEKALVWFWAQLRNEYAPDALRLWSFKRALFGLSAGDRQRWLKTMTSVLGEMS